VDLSFLPAINATLNSVATVLLVVGRVLIKRGRARAHRAVMLSAFGVSCLFLALYGAHKVSRGFENTTFNAVGAAKAAYLALLFTHLTLAMAVPVMAIFLLRYGLRDDRVRHVRLARIAWPVWMYVSITGVLIYFLLYQFNPAA
jgi:putative membrane protein